jgi:hypothetical protein
MAMKKPEESANEIEPFPELVREIQKRAWQRVSPKEIDRYFNAPDGRASIRIRGHAPTPRVFLTARSTTGEPRWGIDWSPELPATLQIHLLLEASGNTDTTC